MDNGKILKMEISLGVCDLLTTPDTPDTPEDIFVFEGDLCQMLDAANVARKLGIETGVIGGMPYVRLKEEYDKVVKYIVDNKISGYWHYEKK